MDLRGLLLREGRERGWNGRVGRRDGRGSSGEEGRKEEGREGWKREGTSPKVGLHLPCSKS